MALKIGDEFAGYTVRRLLGIGGMGEVYLASHPRLERLDALKILPAAFTSDLEYRARFTREADLAASLWHPHIVGIHDRGEFDDHLWISMDYVDGTDAARLLSHSPGGIPLAEAIDIVTAIGDALDFAHQRRLLHRDVKPHNILLTDIQSGRRRILLADFGIARSEDEISGLTATNLTLGTVDYAAPEQLMGEPLSGHSDQYALAATAYNLITGTKLFEHSNPAVTISKHLNSTPPRLSETRPEFAALDAIFLRALAKAPGERYDTCTDFAEALRNGAATSPTMRAPLTLPYADSISPSSAECSSAATQYARKTRAAAPPPANFTDTSNHAPQRSETSRGGSSRRNQLIAITCASLAVIVAVGLTLVVVNRTTATDDKSRPSAASRTPSPAPTRTVTQTTSAAPTATQSPPSTGVTSQQRRSTTGNYTIANYIQDNRITEAQVKRGDEGAPTVNLPAPAGWMDAGPATPEWAYSQIVFTDPSMPPPPPTITAIMSKLTGDVDVAKVLEFAPGELRNLPQFDGPAEGQPDKLGGFDAVQVGGTYVKDGKNLLVAQKTTVIPVEGGVFVLQINAEGTEEQMGPLMDATSAIDDETTITP